MDKRKMVAQELLVLAKSLLAIKKDEEVETEDPKWAEKIQTLKQGLSVVRSKGKRKQLRQFGIPLIRPTATIEELVDALLKITAG